MKTAKTFAEFLFESGKLDKGGKKSGKVRNTFEPLSDPSEDDKSKEAEEKREKLKKYNAFYDKINSEYPEGSGRYDYWEKEMPAADKKEYEDLLMEVKPIRITRNAGGVMSVQTFDLGDSGADAEILGRRYQQAIIDDVKKNGKPKGVIMDLRRNVGGQQGTAKSLVDFFTPNKKGEEIDVERQRDYMVPKDWTYDDYKEKGSFDITKEEFEEAKKKGYVEKVNTLKSTLDDKDKLLDMPVVTLTSQRTFSGGEFITDTIKNLNPNAVHIGHNSGGGSNQIGPSYLDNNKDKKPTEIVKDLTNRIEEGYVDKEKAKKYKEALEKLVKDGKITDNMPKEEVAKIMSEEGNKVLKDFHFSAYYDPESGMLDATIPYMKSDRVVTDPKTKKPKEPKEFNGNWELTGTGNAGTAPFIESDPNTGVRDAMAHIYKQSGQQDMLDKLKKNPEELGLSKEGYDDGFDRNNPKHQHWLARDKESGDPHYLSNIEKSLRNSDEVKKLGSIEDITDKAVKQFRSNSGEEEIKTIKDIGTVKLLNGLDPKIAKAISDMKVVVSIPGGKQKSIKNETLMDFVPVDINDPEEKAMIQAQMRQYNRINALRTKQKLEPLVDFNIWLKRSIELAKDNLGFQARIKAKAEKGMKAVSDAKADKIEQAAAAKAKAEQAKAAKMKAAQAAKMKAAKAKAAKKPTVKESFVYSFDQFLVEEENNRVFESITRK
jgi:hypothetical protein